MNRSEKFWDKSAGKFDREGRKDEHTYNWIIDRTAKYLKAGDTVMDLGCGTGLVSNEIAGMVKIIHAVDTSSKMLEIAKNKASGRNTQNIYYTHLTIFDDRYKSASFDVIMAFYILHLLEDSRQTVQRINDLLKPGGFIVSVTPCIGDKTFLGMSLSLLSRLGFIPFLRPFKASDLPDTLTAGNFEIVENERMDQNMPQYFIAGRKK